jgi:LysM repeat protein
MKLNRYSRLLFSVLFILGMVLIPSQVHAQETDAEKLIGYVNAYRQLKGIGQLTMDPILMSSAQVQADYLAKTYNVEKGGDGTIGDRGTLPSDRAYQRGYAPWGRYDVVECWIVLNKIYPLENVVSNDWWRTKANQKNLLDGWGTSHSDIGVGIAARDSLVFYVVDIGQKLDGPNTVYATDESGKTFSYEPVETSTPGPDGSVIHVVKAGETLQIIALSYGVSVQTILDNNGLKSSNIIYPDQTLVIRLPAGETTPGANRTVGAPTATQTIAPTFTPRPPATETPIPTLAPPTPTVTPTPKPQGQNPINIGTIGLGAVVLGIIILIIYFIMNRRMQH